MLCNTCKKENRSIARYCKSCGAEIFVTQQNSNPALNETHDQKDEVLTGNADLDELIGLNDLKMTYNKAITAFRNMRQANLEYDKRNLHSFLIGETGTGKSKVVDTLSRVFYKAGITSRIDPKIVAAADFDSFTEEGIKESLDKAKDRIVYIDNVHQLVKGGSSTSLEKLISEIEKRPADPIVILGGRTGELRSFLTDHPELNNRIAMQFYLPSIPVDQMLELAERFANNDKFSISADGKDKLRKRLLHLFRQQNEPAQALLIGQNGFLVHKEMKKIVVDYFNKSNYNPMSERIIGPEDITGKIAEIKTVDEVLEQLDDFVGMADLKSFIKESMELLKVGKADEALSGKKRSFSAHMVVTGNPGTGKTTLALALGEVFMAAGMLSSGHVVNADRSTLVGQYMGETAKLVQKACDEAMGGILLIDEVYALKQDDRDSFGQEAIDTLLKRMEDDRDKFIVIAAGYEQLMHRFVSANPGIKSRIKKFFHLNDYTPDQMLEIFRIFARKDGYSLHPDAEKKVAVFLEDLYKKRTSEFANGRDVRNLFDDVCGKRASRMVNNNADHSMEIKVEDIPDNDADLSQERIDALLEEMNSLTGLTNVKKEVNDLIEYLEGSKIITDAGGEKTELTLHFIFSGSPGTGKTTIARIIAGILKSLRILPKGHLIEVDAKDIVGRYVGETAQKTAKILERAMGGILFIDEAYTLTATGGQHDFNSEAISTILKSMEDNRGNLIVIAAGYTEPMKKFLKSNPGLPSRFTRTIDFPDYSIEELMAIATNMLNEAGKIYSAETTAAIQQRIEYIYQNRDDSFANARTIRTEFQNITQSQAIRLARSKRAGIDINPMEILPEDIRGEKQQTETQESLEYLIGRLDNLIGLHTVKRELRSLMSFLEMEKLRREKGGKDTILNLHFLFKGRPGTGKTTVAKILARIFKQMGLLPKGQLIETDRKDLVAGYTGQTAIKMSEVIDKAMGGVLFIDEAYTLAVPENPSDFGKEAIDILVKRMEDYKGKFIVIAAGYEDAMDIFLQANEGLPSRFTKEIIFEDYSPEELAAIFRSMVETKGMELSQSANEYLPLFFTDLYSRRDSKFANGRTVRNIFENSLQLQSQRLMALRSDSHPIEDLLDILEPDDIVAVSQ